MASAAYLTNALRPKTKYAAIIGSYGWGATMPVSLTAMLPLLKVEWLPQVNIGGAPKAEDFAALDRLAEDILKVNTAAPALVE